VVVGILRILRDEVKVSGVWRFTWEESGQVVKIVEKPNLIVQSGLEALAAIIVDEIPQGNAIFLALGTSTTPPAKTDTTLKAEGFRKILTDKSRFSNEIRLRFYLMTTEANGLWKEAGVFLAGTEIANSGWLLNRIIPSGNGINKVSNQSLTVEIRVPLQ
jgi:hypothetical protein